MSCFIFLLESYVSIAHLLWTDAEVSTTTSRASTFSKALVQGWGQQPIGLNPVSVMRCH